MEDERKFSMDEICQHSKEILGVYPEVVHGAFPYAEGKDMYSLSKVRKAVDDFMKRKVV